MGTKDSCEQYLPGHTHAYGSAGTHMKLSRVRVRMPDTCLDLLSFIDLLISSPNYHCNSSSCIFHPVDRETQQCFSTSSKRPWWWFLSSILDCIVLDHRIGLLYFRVFVPVFPTSPGMACASTPSPLRAYQHETRTTSNQRH